MIREATASDADAIARVHRESWRTTYTGILPAAVIGQRTERQTADEWRTRLARATPRDAVWLAEREGQVVGFASCGTARHRLGGLEAEVYALYVLQSWQRRGVGRELLGACARHFVRHGELGFYLWVLKANRARLFYEAVGGVELGEKTERIGMHSFFEVAYGWRELAPLAVAVG